MAIGGLAGYEKAIEGLRRSQYPLSGRAAHESLMRCTRTSPTESRVCRPLGPAKARLSRLLALGQLGQVVPERGSGWGVWMVRANPSGEGKYVSRGIGSSLGGSACRFG